MIMSFLSSWLVILGLMFQQTAPVGEQASLHFKLKYDKDLTTAAVKQIQDSLESRYTFYQKALKFSAPRKITVRLVATEERFSSEVKAPLFEGGVYTESGITLNAGLIQDDLKKFNYTLSRVVVTAMTAQLNSCPRWFGMAYGMYVGNETHHFDGYAPGDLYAFSDLDEAYGRATSVRELKEVYSALGTTIQFLVGKFGERRVQAVFSQLQKGNPLEPAFGQTFGVDIEELQQQWQHALTAKHK